MVELSRVRARAEETETVEVFMHLAACSGSYSGAVDLRGDRQKAEVSSVWLSVTVRLSCGLVSAGQ